MDLKAAFLACLGHMVYEIAEINVYIAYLGKHYHCEISIQNRLGNIYNVGTAFGALRAYLCNDADTVFTCDRNNCFQLKKPPVFVYKGQKAQIQEQYNTSFTKSKPLFSYFLLNFF